MSFLRDYTVSLGTIVEVGLVGALIAGVVFVSSSKGGSSTGSEAEGKKSKNKKKRKQVKEQSPTAEKENISSQATTQPAPAPAPAATAPAPAPTSAPKKKKGKAPAAPAPTPAPAPAPAPIAPSSNAPSFAKVAAPSPPTSTTSSTPATKPKKTAAEKALRSEPKSATSDMRDESIDPTPQAARVMKVVGGKLGAKEPEPEPWGDDGWEQHEDEGAWETAKPVKKPTRSAGGSSFSSSAFAASNPAPARSIPGLPSASQSAQASKNAKAKAKAAALKDEAERERLQRLAEHRKGLERARMLEQEAQRNKGKPKSGPRSENFTSSEPKFKPKSGGMTASLDSDSNLIWE